MRSIPIRKLEGELGDVANSNRAPSTPGQPTNTQAQNKTVSGVTGIRLQEEVLASNANAQTNYHPGANLTVSGASGDRLKQEYYQVRRDENRSFRHLRKMVTKRKMSFTTRTRRGEAREKEKEIADKKFESFDYDFMETTHLRHMHAGLTGSVILFDKHTEVVRWFLVILIGIILGVVAYVMTLMLQHIMDWKFKVIQDLVSKGDMEGAYGFHIAVVVLCMGFASLMANFSPVSAGSGIPVVKAYLNGNNIKGICNWETFIAKFFGVMACVTAGMPAGREGPMVHLGAIVSAGLARGESKLLPKGFSCFHFNTFDNAKDMRDFVSIGAGAGVAAAFNAPVGGILFSLEEVSSFWSGDHMYAVFIASTLASATLNMILTAQKGGKTTDDGLILFGQAGKFEEFSFTDFHYWEVAIFAVIGVLGGLLGGIFCLCNKAITIQRKRFYAYMDSKYAATASNPTPCLSSAKLRCVLTMLESMITMGVVATIFFFLPQAFSCRATNDVADSHILSEATSHGLSPIQHDCLDPVGYDPVGYVAHSDDPHMDAHHRFLSGGGGLNDHAYFNDMATLIFNPQEGVAKQLFSRSTAGYFRIEVLSTFLAVFFPCACYCYGLFVPAGLFVPSLISGAAMGRLIGELLRDGLEVDYIDPGMYALIGAGALLAGITRMTISLAVILIELTNDINFLLPILLTIAFAKTTGDYVATSIYDTHIELMGVPFLEPEPPGESAFRICQDAMKTNVVTVRVIEDLEVLKRTLSRYSHNAFPVIDPGKSGQGRTFVGIISRQVLEMLIDETKDHVQRVQEGSENPTPDPLSAVFEISEESAATPQKLAEDADSLRFAGKKSRPRTPRRQSVRSPIPVEHALADAIHLENSMDPSPFVVQESLPLSRAYRIFTRMGLRHLVVITESHIVTGILTRKDFAFGHAEPLHEIGEKTSLRYIRDSSARTANVNKYRRANSKLSDGGCIAVTSPRGSDEATIANRVRSSSF
jgi:H+/Cl- antiporter ClcA